MAKIDPIQFTLNAGIYSPKLAEREDTEAYYAAVRDMLNMRPLAEGGAEARPGWMFAQAMRGPLSEIDLTAVSISFPAGVVVTSAGQSMADPSGGQTDPPSYPGEDTLLGQSRWEADLS